jgi:hypothetical protein
VKAKAEQSAADEKVVAQPEAWYAGVVMKSTPLNELNPEQKRLFVLELMLQMQKVHSSAFGPEMDQLLRRSPEVRDVLLEVIESLSSTEPQGTGFEASDAETDASADK